ncbi:Alanyl-tRNA synthetase, partial [hydrothermal vent metagenome]
PVIDAVNRHLEKNKSTLTQTEKYIIADHMRAVAFSITDGVMPSNEGRGYVVKKLIIEMSDILLRANIKKPQVSNFIDVVANIMNKTYPEISKKSSNIKNIIDSVENAYIKVRKEKMPELLKSVKKSLTNSNKLGELFFSFRDTHGLTIDTITEILSTISVDKNILDTAWKQYHVLMEKQKEQSRASSKMTGDVFIESDLDLNVPKTKFLGYEQTSANLTLLKLFKENQEVDFVEKNDKIQIITDQTPFYAESGGQISDTGYFRANDNEIRILNTQKTNDIFIHLGIVEKGTFKKNDSVQGSVDNIRRLSIIRNHTATHLLQAAMREILGTHIAQQGSYVGEDRLRFDFTHPTAVKKDELNQIERKVNDFILACDPIVIKNLSLDEAKKEGALAFFAEKYGDIVRVVVAGNYSKEFCGGTHCQFTGQIGLFKIISESAIAQGIRRIEAVTGTVALEILHQQEDLVEQLAKKMKSSKEEILPKLTLQQKRLKELENQLASQQWQNIQETINNILENKKSIKNIDIISSNFKNLDMNLLRKISDSLKKKSSSSIIILGSHTKDSASLLLAVTDDLIEKGFKANELILEVAPLINGSGGGRPQLACAGSSEPAKI